MLDMTVRTVLSQRVFGCSRWELASTVFCCGDTGCSVSKARESSARAICVRGQAACR